MNQRILKIALISGASVLGLAIAETTLGYALWRKKNNHGSSIAYSLNKAYCHFNYLKCTVSAEGTGGEIQPTGYLQADKTLGFSLLPGNYTVKGWNTKLGKQHQWNASINEKGRRITSINPINQQGKPKVLVFGDSFTWGQGNDDQTSFPFLLQSRLKDHEVVNNAIPGAGNTHALIMLRKMLGSNKPPPGSISNIVAFYGDYYNPRNVAAPSRLREFQLNSNNPNITAFHPKAELTANQIDITKIEFDSKSKSGEDPSQELQHEITLSILNEIASISGQIGASLIVAFHSGKDDDPVVKAARSKGINVVDIRPSKEDLELDSFTPIDLHPGPKTQNSYARKIAPWITKQASHP